MNICWGQRPAPGRGGWVQTTQPPEPAGRAARWSMAGLRREPAVFSPPVCPHPALHSGRASQCRGGPGRPAHLVLRSRGGDDPMTCLWHFDVAGPVRAPGRSVTAGRSGGELPPEELARRERIREQAGGIVDYATDNAVNTVAFALSGRLWVATVDDGEVRELVVKHPAVDPRPDPTGTLVAYVNDGALRVIGIDGRGDRSVAEPEGPEVTYGLAEFVAAEEMGRFRGYWWSPDGERLSGAACRRTGGTSIWYVTAPVDPAFAPRAVRLSAGRHGQRGRVAARRRHGRCARVRSGWDRLRFEYVVIGWTGPPTARPGVWCRAGTNATIRVLASTPAPARHHREP